MNQTCGLFEVVGLAASAPVVCKLNELYYVSGANGSLSNGAGNKRKFPGIPSSISLCLFVPYRGCTSGGVYVHVHARRELLLATQVFVVYLRYVFQVLINSLMC